MKVLTTGITGTIGRHLPNSVHPLNIDLAAFPSAKSFSDIGAMDHFLHLAGVVGTIEVEKDKNYSHTVNVNGATSQSSTLNTRIMHKRSGALANISEILDSAINFCSA